MADDLTAFGLGELVSAKTQDALADYVKSCYTKAAEHKRASGVRDRLFRNLRVKRCVYQPDEVDLLGPYNNVYVGIAALKARAAASWLVDLISSNMDKPWEINPTPEPQLPENLMVQAIQMLFHELPTFNTIEALRDRATQVKSALQNIDVKQAQDATRRMSTRIDDQLTEGDWISLYSDFIDDLTVYSTAFMRGPIQVNVIDTKWAGNKLAINRKPSPRMRLISPFDAYPAPYATSIQDSSYFIEVKKYAQSDLYNLIGVPGFTESSVRQALKQYDCGFTLDTALDSERAALEESKGVEDKDPRIDVIIFDGKVKGEYLIDHNIIVDDPQKFYEAEIWCVGDVTIKAMLNPSPTGKRLVYGTSYVRVNGDIWGQSTIDTVYDVQRTCNAAIRGIIRNMGYSSGPIGEVVGDRISDADDELDIKPYKVFRVGPDITGTGAPAFRFHNVASVSGELMAVFQQFSKIADDLSGVPAYVLGNPQVAGAGRTLGGLSMLMGNAAKGIKQVQLNIDRDIIAPVITAYYFYNLSTSKDAGIKADAKVVARGATGLLQRELAQTRTVEILQLLTPYVQAQVIDKTALDYILRSILQNTGLPVDKMIPDPDSVNSVQDLTTLLGGAPNASVNGSMQAMNTGTSQQVNLPPQSMPPAQPANLAPIPTPINLAQGA